ncbi:MAG: PspA/IM30 family protein, partial [Chloroflexi bacterium]|nr:PspA/IM30 family protein [Chloroflexota bacterium]
MRNFRSRLALFFNVKTGAALDQAEDPREILDYAYGQQQLHLHTVRRGLVEVAAARAQLDRQLDRLRARVEHLEDQARRALRAEREALARQALERKQASLAEIGALERQRAELVAEEERLTAAQQQLAQRVDRFRVRRNVAAARYAAAEAEVSVGEALAGLAPEGEVELGLAVVRSEERIDQLSARAAALTSLIDTGGLGPVDVEDPLEQELADMQAATAVDAELAELKRQLAELAD